MFGRELEKIAFRRASSALRSAVADRLGKRGFSEVGYQFQKHFGRGVGDWASAISGDATLNPATFNKAGYNTFKEIWKAPGSFQKVGGFLEKRLMDGTLLYRLNVGYENAESFRDLMFDRNFVIAPSLTFLPSEKTRINFDLVYTDSKSRLDKGQPIFGSFDLNSTPQSLSLNSANNSLSNTYTYWYDKLTGLTEGESMGVAMNEEISYDVMGNINTLKRDGSGHSQYHYNGNRLWYAAYVTNGYAYDANGNATRDGRTGFDWSYNHLNLPKPGE